jgi:hypothetical protein
VCTAVHRDGEEGAGRVVRTGHCCVPALPDGAESGGVGDGGARGPAREGVEEQRRGGLTQSPMVQCEWRVRVAIRCARVKSAGVLVMEGVASSSEERALFMRRCQWYAMGW